MLVNGMEQAIDAEGTVPLLIEDRTMLPVRAVVEAMGGTVAWDGDTQTVTLARNGVTLRLIIDSNTAYVNDTPETLDTAPIIVNDRTMLPIRFIAESFHFDVEWDEAGQRVIITETAEATEQTQPQNPAQTQEPSPEPTKESAPEPETPAAPNENQITVSVNGQDFTATLEDNETAKAFYAMLPLTLEMDELNGNEKYYFLDESLPGNHRQIGQIQNR